MVVLLCACVCDTNSALQVFSNSMPPLSLCGSEGSNLTPAHHYGDFRFKTYAPIAFRYFREMFGIRPDDYMVSSLTECLYGSSSKIRALRNKMWFRVQISSRLRVLVAVESIGPYFILFCAVLLQYSLCNERLIELSNSGASGSLFYLSSDDEFIIKTVQHKEAEFLQKLLPGYFMVSQNENI